MLKPSWRPGRLPSELTLDAEAELEAGQAAADVRTAATVTEHRLQLQTVAAQLLQHPGRLLEPVRPRLAVLTHVVDDCLVFLGSLPHHLSSQAYAVKVSNTSC